MAANMKDGDDKKDWPDKNEAAFLQMLHERTINHPKKAPSYKPSDWEAMNKEMSVSTGVNYGAEKLKAKYHRLRIRTRQFSQLLAHTGVTWNANSNTVDAPDDVWEHFIKLDKKNFKSYRRNGCKNYYLLCEIFNHTIATRILHYASTQQPPTEEEERELENDFMSGGTESTEQVGQKRAASENSGERRAKKETRYDKVEACLELLSSSLATRAKILEEKAKKNEKAVNSPISSSFAGSSSASFSSVFEPRMTRAGGLAPYRRGAAKGVGCLWWKWKREEEKWLQGDAPQLSSAFKASVARVGKLRRIWPAWVLRARVRLRRESFRRTAGGGPAQRPLLLLLGAAVARR